MGDTLKEGVGGRSRGPYRVPKTPSSLFFFFCGENEMLQGLEGESKNVHLHPPGLRSLCPCKKSTLLCPPPLPPTASLPRGGGLISLSDGWDFCV